MKALRLLVAVAIVAGFVASSALASYVRDDGMKVELIHYGQITFEGQPAWEYVYDLSVRNAAGKPWSTTYFMAFQFEFGDGGTIGDHILNMYSIDGEWRHWDIWEQFSTTGQHTRETGPNPAYGYRDTDTWELAPRAPEDLEANGWKYDAGYAAARGKLNTWHVPSDYADVEIQGNRLHWWQGEQVDWSRNPDGIQDDLFHWYNYTYAESEDYLLYRTMYYVSDLGPYGTMELGYDSNSGNDRSAGIVIGPGVAPVVIGDLDGDGDIDADDIDLMGDYIRTGIAPTTANYDLSDDGATGGTDGSVTILDLDYLVRYLVETSAVDGDGNPIFGTQYGDFNLDGEIELGDLTRLGTYYGVGSMWAEGNANPHLDEDIELGDLTILGTYYGASNGGVDAIPEPATMSLLALGGLAALRRRRK